MPKRRAVLLRIANVNPDSVSTHSDRVLYGAVGVFILLYVAYATAGGAAFVDASAGYSHPWWQWLVGPLVATGVVAYDRAVVGRVAVSFERLDSADPRHLLKKPTLVLYLGRLGLALLFAVIITEPLMLARYRGEIDARLGEVHDQQLAAAEAGGAIAAYDTRLKQLAALTAGEDRSVAILTGRAAGKRRDARTLYAQALSDSVGDGVSRKRGCPRGGYCDTLVKRSRGLDDQASALDAQAARLQDGQRAGRSARAGEEAALTRAIADQRAANARAIRADAGFGARTKAMWYLVTSDFWGIGVFYLGIALMLVALDCAAVGLKLVSHGNAYERAEARVARRREHEAAITLEREIRDAEAYGQAAARVVVGGIDAATRNEALVRAAGDRARARLYAAVAGITPAEPAAPAIEAQANTAGTAAAELAIEPQAKAAGPAPAALSIGPEAKAARTVGEADATAAVGRHRRLSRRPYGRAGGESRYREGLVQVASER